VRRDHIGKKRKQKDDNDDREPGNGALIGAEIRPEFA
jgi:hypothetical protein